MSEIHNEGKIEALLFVSGEPLSVLQMAKITGLSKKQVEEALKILSEQLSRDDSSGLMVIQNGERAELATKSEHADIVQVLSKSTLQEHLSRAALEILSIIAYRAPVTRAHIEAIRGVNCSFTLRNLLLRGLIERAENPEDSREFIYTPSFAFLEKMGASSVEGLPDYGLLSRDERVELVTETAKEAETTKE